EHRLDGGNGCEVLRSDLGLRDREIELCLDGQHEAHHLDRADAELRETRIDGQRTACARGAHGLAYEAQKPLACSQGRDRTRFTHYAHASTLFCYRSYPDEGVFARAFLRICHIFQPITVNRPCPGLPSRLEPRDQLRHRKLRQQLRVPHRRGALAERLDQLERSRSEVPVRQGGPCRLLRTQIPADVAAILLEQGRGLVFRVPLQAHEGAAALAHEEVSTGLIGEAEDVEAGCCERIHGQLVPA